MTDSDKPVVFLEDIAEKLEEVDSEWRIFMNRKNGELISCQNEYLGIAEELETEDELDVYGKWEREEIHEAMGLLEHWADYVELPSQYDIHEYSIMEDFAEETPNPGKRELLLVALSGKGAFRRFKDILIRTGLEETWYAYRFLAFVEIAREWCEDNKISYRTKT